MRHLVCLVAILILTATNAVAQVSPVEISVTVTAAEARRMEASVKSIRSNRDPFLASISRHLMTLTEALAQPNPLRRSFAIGPLTPSESAFIKLEDYLLRYQVGEGPIHIRMRLSWDEWRQDSYNFTPSSFLAMLASIASGPFVQVPVLQQQQVLFLGRTILDLNEQAGSVIPDREIFAALANVFKDKHVGERVIRICIRMADDGRTFELVPRDLVEDFQKHGGAAFIVPAPRGAPRTVKLTINEVSVVTRPDDLIWSFLRFFAGDNSQDWALQAAARSRAALARKILEYLEAQIARPPTP